MKTCRRCKLEKPDTEFRVDTRYKDGLASWCSLCYRENNSKWAKENRERLTKKAAVWRAENLEKSREIHRRHHRANAKKRGEAHAAWAKNNKGKRSASTARYKAAKLRATPRWADHESIRLIYEESARIQKETGVRMHVDHYYPLQHELVCGLHCEQNLRIITGAQNESKRNKWPIEDAQRQGDMFI